MADVNTAESPLEAVAGAAGPHATDAFKLLSTELRLAILLALWEAYDPYGTDNTVAFSELFDNVGASDSGNFNYHLGKLTDHFVKETADGYELREAGLRIVQAVIAGTGLDEQTLDPTEIDMVCYRCGASVELGYRNERLYWICTECEGNRGLPESRPPGTLSAWPFPAAGLPDRTPGELFVVATIKSFKDLELFIRGICPECSGPVDSSLRICEAHEATTGQACPTCGGQDEVSARYACSVCKHAYSYSAQAAVHGHPAVVAFCHEHGIDRTFDLDDAEACNRFWHHLYDRRYTLVSEDPIRLRVTVPGDMETLQLTLDGNLDVINVTRASS